VGRALALARAFAERAALEAQAADSLAIIVEEWLSNVVEHGGAPASARIVLRLQHAPRQVKVVVTDAGRPFDPRTAVFQGPNPERGGGAGLALIQAWSRIADYSRRRGRNRLVLEMPIT
jgi:serine/threonine-protein kinase RsbW